MNKKTVLLPIVVPDNDYCWNYETPCTYFSNDGGHGICDLSIGTLKRDAQRGYPKPILCMQLPTKTV